MKNALFHTIMAVFVPLLFVFPHRLNDSHKPRGLIEVSAMVKVLQILKMFLQNTLHYVFLFF